VEVDAYAKHTDHQEWGSQIDADELNAAIHSQAKGCQGGHNGRDIAHETQEGLRANCIAHHAGDDAECLEVKPIMYSFKCQRQLQPLT